MRRILPLFLVCVAAHAEGKAVKWTRRAMVAGYCAASAYDGWQSTRPGVAEANPILRSGNGQASIGSMVAFKATLCGVAVLSLSVRGRYRSGALVGVTGLLGAQVVTDVHNAKEAR
jgi:hypothetical protein